MDLFYVSESEVIGQMMVIVNYKDKSFSYFEAKSVEDALTKADALPTSEIESLLVDGERYSPRKAR